MHTYLIDTATAPYEDDLDADEGWVDMQVQFLVNSAKVGASQFVVGRAVYPPGARHDYHRHHSAEEFVFVLRGEGIVMTDDEEVAVRGGQMVYHPRNVWHAFRNPSATEVCEVIWAWGGSGTKEGAGYEVRTATDR